MQDMNGRQVGDYRIIEKIGEGGMGMVFKGFDLMLERDVAIKMLRSDLANQPKVVERFRTEAIALARLNHPNIATVYSFLNQDDDYFMVMEYVPGDTLARIIKKQGAVSFRRAIALFLQALDAVAHAHEMGVIHRDIKPANILLTETDVLKLTDFGIARVIGTSRITRKGSAVGTVEYMSPEQILGEEGDARSDIYSLGILLYEMLLGRVPFESDSEFELMKSQVEELPPPPRTLANYIPLEVEEAIMRSLAKKAEARFQNAFEFRAALEHCLHPSTIPLDPSVARASSEPLFAAPATRVDESLSVSDFQTVSSDTIHLGSPTSDTLIKPELSDSDSDSNKTRVYGSTGYDIETEATPADALNPPPRVLPEETRSEQTESSALDSVDFDERPTEPVSQSSLINMREGKYYLVLVLLLMVVLSGGALKQTFYKSSAQTSQTIQSAIDQPVSSDGPDTTQSIQAEQTENASTETSVVQQTESNSVARSRNTASAQETSETPKKAAGNSRKKEGRVGKVFKKILRLGID